MLYSSYYIILPWYKRGCILLCRVPGVEFDTLVKFDSSVSKVLHTFDCSIFSSLSVLLILAVKTTYQFLLCSTIVEN